MSKRLIVIIATCFTCALVQTVVDEAVGVNWGPFPASLIAKLVWLASGNAIAIAVTKGIK